MGGGALVGPGHSSGAAPKASCVEAHIPRLPPQVRVHLDQVTLSSEHILSKLFVHHIICVKQLWGEGGGEGK